MELLIYSSETAISLHRKMYETIFSTKKPLEELQHTKTIRFLQKKTRLYYWIFLKFDKNKEKRYILLSLPNINSYF